MSLALVDPNFALRILAIFPVPKDEVDKHPAGSSANFEAPVTTPWELTQTALGGGLYHSYNPKAKNVTKVNPNNQK
ncbi:uncharacterized protein ARMOST_09427 [Armillaria ostoyae]|uniref:Uncharacterized protein n=1 Tax=Armillaria ostoyae TaxID=47428 RepID=A0A284RBG5_ARMOS|nr:uncharacterized protein ARMOST_09427 [Armillaria ostoyae]